MSKYLKQLITDQLSSELDGVTDCVLVNVIGLSANETVDLRKQLREKNIRLRVVKNSMAVRATEGTALAPAFEGTGGTLAVCFGGDDFISLVKEVHRREADEDNFEQFTARGGVMDGEPLTPEMVVEVSKWPSREEQLSILVGQLLGPGRTLLAQLESAGANLAGQIDQIDGSTSSSDAEASDDAEADAPAEEAADDSSDGGDEAEAPADEAAADDASDSDDAEEAPAEEASDDSDDESEAPAEEEAEAADDSDDAEEAPAEEASDDSDDSDDQSEAPAEEEAEAADDSDDAEEAPAEEASDGDEEDDSPAEEEASDDSDAEAEADDGASDEEASDDESGDAESEED